MTRQQEVDRNYEVFLKLLPAFSKRHGGTFALMKDGKILGFHESATDARLAAETSIDDDLYSIQPVSREPIELGAFSDAVPVD